MIFKRNTEGPCQIIMCLRIQESSLKSLNKLLYDITTMLCGTGQYPFCFPNLILRAFLHSHFETRVIFLYSKILEIKMCKALFAKDQTKEKKTVIMLIDKLYSLFGLSLYSFGTL